MRLFGNRMKKKMLRKRGKSFANITALDASLNEQLLFHGTKEENIVSIYSQRGFDWRISGKHRVSADVIYVTVCLLLVHKW